MEKMVLGFLFNNIKDSVLLIKKKRPDWQKGLLNGIGGHIEKGENADQAIRREFHEETGIELPFGFLNNFCQLKHPNWIVFCYAVFNTNLLNSAESLTDEVLHVENVNDLSSQLIIPNLVWLIPMALSNDNFHIATVLYT